MANSNDVPFSGTRPGPLSTSRFADWQSITAKVLETCGARSILHVGSGGGEVVQLLLTAGVDARGIDPLPENVDMANRRTPGRFVRGEYPRLPIADAGVETVICIGSLDESPDQHVATSLGELSRVARQNLFLCVATRSRSWWEERLFEAGFRKHPKYYRICPYESLEHEPAEIFIVMEKVPPAVPRHSDSPPDMLRVSGRSSDSRLVRYDLCRQYVRPGDTVVDLACGTGDGLHVLQHNCAAGAFIGFDPDERAIEYARAHFGGGERPPTFRNLTPTAALASLVDHSADVVIAFGVPLAQVETCDWLCDVRRVLIPGGRLIVSAAAEGDSALSREIIRDRLSSHLLVENFYQQRIDGPADTSRDEQQVGRWLRQASWSGATSAGGQVWIATAIRDPLANAETIEYRETVFGNLRPADHPSTNYARWYCNPWIVHSLVHVGFRVKSSQLLENLAGRLLASSPQESADHGAALCVLAYRQLDAATGTVDSNGPLREQIQRYLLVRSDNPHVLRWRISLCFVLAQLQLKAGEIAGARHSFDVCSQMDPRPFGIHLATKPAEAFFWCGWLALNQGDLVAAERAWSAGVEFGSRLWAEPMDGILMNRTAPNLFDFGDGMREFTHTVESITKCTNGLHLIYRQRAGQIVDWTDVHRTFRASCDWLRSELREAQWKLGRITSELVETRADLRSRTGEVQAARADLKSRTAELEVCRQDLISRTVELDNARADLIARTSDLDATRRELVERTAELDTARQDLVGRTAELDHVRKELIERTTELDAARGLTRSNSRQSG